MNRRVSRILFTSLAASALVAGLLPSTASASTNFLECRDDFISYSLDYASTKDGIGGGCGDVAVQATFRVSGSSSSITTGWIWDATYARTGTVKEIQSMKSKND